jgi:hypothetical protein
VHFTAVWWGTMCSFLNLYFSYTLLHSFILFNTPQYCTYVLQVIFDPYRTGFEDSKTFAPPKGTIIAGRYEVTDVLGQVSVVWCSLFVVVFGFMCVNVCLVNVILSQLPYLSLLPVLLLTLSLLSLLTLSSLLSSPTLSPLLHYPL